jgi:hypothetical protein
MMIRQYDQQIMDFVNAMNLGLLFHVRHMGFVMFYFLWHPDVFRNEKDMQVRICTFFLRCLKSLWGCSEFIFAFRGKHKNLFCLTSGTSEVPGQETNRIEKILPVLSLN